ncbi:outer membrane putative beta-barrel porin/alpha-amylase [Ulvibacter sp. MAR_2010_11]|uniref:transporter n=1 Tax=Ulvibacter sp. MAR_2010_11 TaxID=1250229 RepID=UPI000C2BFD21|nr:transporter [Ulvibacter sp. MAR_2010_11]PKA84037.1 outer membrane putative beta-barrel porin/alpha-amylase [Ulvibacter sp. MAR_2010_11]
MHTRNILFLFLLIPFLNVSAQYTEELNSNRPGASLGAFSVGKKVLQFESGLSIGKEKHRLLQTETNAFIFDYSVRYGVWKEELEVSLMGEYQSNTNTFLQFNPSEERKVSNFRSNTLGAKYLVYDPYRKMVLEGPNLYSWKANNKMQWKDLIPAVSVYAGANFDFTENPVDKLTNPYSTSEDGSSISPKFVLSTQNNWIGGFVFVTNIIVDRITTDEPVYSYILTLTHTPTDWFSIFVENQGIKSDFYADQLFRGGAAVLITENFQVDGSVIINFKDTPSRFYARVGASYRFDMHDTDEYVEEKGKSGRKNKKANKEKRKKDKKSKRKDGVEDDGGDGGTDGGDGGL